MPFLRERKPFLYALPQVQERSGEGLQTLPQLRLFFADGLPKLRQGGVSRKNVPGMRQTASYGMQKKELCGIAACYQ
jgi:hypothetical protein